MNNINEYATPYQVVPLLALAICKSGRIELDVIRSDLLFAGNELQRMENESGIPLNGEQIQKVRVYFRLMQRIKKLLVLAQHGVTRKHSKKLLLSNA